MRIQRALVLATLVLCSLPGLAQSPERAAASAPIVRKLEPPNWWTKFTPELTLLLTGEGLDAARVESPTKDLVVVGSEASANGHYLFVQLKMNDSLHPGTVQLRVRTASGSTTVPFPIAARESVWGGHSCPPQSVSSGDTSGRQKRQPQTARQECPAHTGFTRDDVIYLIMPDRFADGDPSNDRPAGTNGVYDRSQPKSYHGGDLRGVREHLGYLHDLGVTTLWLTPVWKNTDSDYHGYHPVDFYALDDHMGTMAEYQSLTAEAHKLGMKVVIDYVANHTGPNHPWANDPPTPTWFHGTPAHHEEASYSFAGLVDPHASPREYRKTLEGWFVDRLPDLNPDDPQLGLYLAQNAMWWTETAQLDGFRLDTFPYSSRKFWSGWHARLRQVYPEINSVGEVADPDSTITSFFEGGRKQLDGIDSGLATVFDFPFEHVLREVVIKSQPIQNLIDLLQHDALYPHPETLVTFLGNHDHKRFLGEGGSSLAKLKSAFSLLLTMRGIPQIYAGDEIGMDGGDDPDNRRDFPGGFPGDLRNAFTAAGRTPEQQDVFAHVQSLLALRKAHPALRTGKQWHIGWDDTYYAFQRESPEEKLLVVYNNAPTHRDLKIPLADTPIEIAQRLESVFGGTSAEIVGGEVRVTVGPGALAVFRVQ